jgi:Holliday junction resolvase-like predicted endonuclease
MKKFTSKTQRTGQIGEKLAIKKLSSLGFKILEINFTRNTGEIDIVAQKGKRLHFVEVKSVSCEISSVKQGKMVTHVINTGYRPEENLNIYKFKKIAKTVEIYLLEKNISHETPWQIDLACVYIDLSKKQGRVEILENIII